MDQWDRDEVELGNRARNDLHFGENHGHPKLREMRIRHRATHAQHLAEIDRIYSEVYGA
jgi:hypothetical protein